MRLDIHVYVHLVGDQNDQGAVLDALRELRQHQQEMEARIVKEIGDLEVADGEEATAINNLTGLVTQGVAKIQDLLGQIGDQAGDRTAVLGLIAKAQEHTASLTSAANQLSAALAPPVSGGATPSGAAAQPGTAQPPS